MKEDIFNFDVPSEHFGVLHAEMRTGIIIDQYGSRIPSANIKYQIFTSLDDARSYSRKKVSEDPEIECTIFNDKKNQVEMVKDYDYIEKVTRELKSIKEARKKTAWWRWW